MAYRFKKSEAIPHAIQRVFAEEISWAVGQLSHSKKRAQAIHEARKSVKKIRALLSLVANRLGPQYKTQDRYFRDAGRLLSDFRDNAVMLEVFDALAAKHPDIDVAAIEEIRENLQRLDREAPPEKDVSSEAVHLLEQARLQAEAWHLEDLQFEMLLPALTAGYRRGRKALRHAQKVETAERLHDFRKEVKEHWYHLRLFENAGNPGMQKRVADLHHLETWLGDEHNLSVLRERLTAYAETSRDRRQTRQFTAWIDAESRALRQRALEAGERLYAERSGAFREQLASLWTVVPKAPARVAPPLRARSAVA